MSKEINPASFYSNTCISVKEWEFRLKFHSNGIERFENYEQFPFFSKQQQAFDYVDEWNSKLCINHDNSIQSENSKNNVLYTRFKYVFSEEISSDGIRKYFAATYQEFWKFYSVMKPGQRRHYEIIRESEPCHLYFDIEFSRNENSNVDGEEVMNIFIRRLQLQLYKKYNVKLYRSCIVHLTSTSKKKFSRHLICHLPNCLFMNVYHVGSFVKELCLEIEQEAMDLNNPDQILMDKLLVSKDGKKVLIVDSGVYSKNRCFRMYLSSKKGKITYMAKAEANLFCESSGTEAEFFLSSMASNVYFPVEYKANIFDTIDWIKSDWDFDPENSNEISSVFYQTAHVHKSRQTLLSPLDVQVRNSVMKENELSLSELDEMLGTSDSLFILTHETHIIKCDSNITHSGGFSVPNTNGFLESSSVSGSMFPALDIFMEWFSRLWPCESNILESYVNYLESEPSAPTSCNVIKKWIMFSDPDDSTKNGTMTYHLSANRYCCHVGRQHKSNQIYFVVDLTNWYFYQKCFDPDCRDYKSIPMEVPFCVQLQCSPKLMMDLM